MEHRISSFSTSFKPLSVDLALSEMNENFQLISMDILSGYKITQINHLDGTRDYAFLWL